MLKSCQIGFFVTSAILSSPAVGAPARDCWEGNLREVAYEKGSAEGGKLYVCRKNDSSYQWDAIEAKLNVPASVANRIPNLVIGKDQLAPETNLTVNDVSFSGQPGEVMVGQDGGRVGWEKNPFVPAVTEVIKLESSGAQAAIDRAMRYIPAGVTVTFQINGVIVGPLVFRGFFGAGKVIVTGGTIQHSGSQSALELTDCHVPVEIKSLTTVAADASTAEPIVLANVRFVPVISAVNMTVAGGGTSSRWAVKTDATSYAVLQTAGTTINYNVPNPSSVADVTASHIAVE